MDLNAPLGIWGLAKPRSMHIGDEIGPLAARQTVQRTVRLLCNIR